MATLWQFFYSQFFVTPPKPTGDYTGKTILVTGANVGLGKEAARHFARLGAAKVIIASRSIEKGEEAKKDIESTTKRSGVVEVWQLDLSSYQSVLDFGARIDKELPRLDSAVLNAGIAAAKFQLFEKDESTITVNVVSTFLLALLVLPKLKQTAAEFNTRPILSIVSSEMHFWAKFEERHGDSIFDTMRENNPKTFTDRYPLSKLLDVFGVRAMAERKPVDQIPVTINTVNPGLCHSELARDAGFGMVIMKALLARTTEVGSRTLVHAGSAGPETHGQYLADCKVSQTSDFCVSEEGHKTQDRFWNELSAKLEAIKPGVTKNL